MVLLRAALLRVGLWLVALREGASPAVAEPQAGASPVVAEPQEEASPVVAELQAVQVAAIHPEAAVRPEGAPAAPWVW